MTWKGWTGAVVALLAWAAPAHADDASRDEIEALRRRLDEQDRRLRALQGTAPTQGDMAAALDAYLAGPAPAFLVASGDDKGSGGFPLGKKPFLKQGPNKVEFAFRNQVRYEAFLYSEDAVGTLSDTGNPVSDAAPRDRTGYEVERLYFGLDGTVFCEDLTFKLELNLDSDGGTGVEKRYAYLDWKYAGDHHVRAGGDKVAYCHEESNSSGALAFVDRSIVTKAFEVGFDTGLSAWGYFGSTCPDRPKQFFYKVQVNNGEGAVSRGSVFNTDGFDTFADTPLFAAMLEWNVTGEEWKWDEVDHRACDERCRWNVSVGASGYYEDDDDLKHDQWGGLALRSSGRADRLGLDAWVRARWNGWSGLVEFLYRDVDYTTTSTGAPSTAPDQTDKGVQATVHYRFADSHWGVGARAGVIWIDEDYTSVTQGPAPGTVVPFDDEITEFGLVVNYFFRDHAHKISADVNWVQGNSGVSSSSAGYLVDPKKGVVIEDGVMLRIQWQITL